MNTRQALEMRLDNLCEKYAVFHASQVGEWLQAPYFNCESNILTPHGSIATEPMEFVQDVRIRLDELRILINALGCRQYFSKRVEDLHRCIETVAESIYNQEQAANQRPNPAEVSSETSAESRISTSAGQYPVPYVDLGEKKKKEKSKPNRTSSSARGKTGGAMDTSEDSSLDDYGSRQPRPRKSERRSARKVQSRDFVVLNGSSDDDYEAVGMDSSDDDDAVYLTGFTAGSTPIYSNKKPVKHSDGKRNQNRMPRKRKRVLEDFGSSSDDEFPRPTITTTNSAKMGTKRTSVRADKIRRPKSRNSSVSSTSSLISSARLAEKAAKKPFLPSPFPASNLSSNQAPILASNLKQQASSKYKLLTLDPEDDISVNVKDFVEHAGVPKCLRNLSAKTPFKSSTDPSAIFRFKPAGHAKESHRKSVYAVSWSKDFSCNESQAEKKSISRYLATCGSRFATLYKIIFDGSSNNGNKSKHFVMLQSHAVDEEEEDFYACTFAGRSKNASPTAAKQRGIPSLLCVGGIGKRIYVIDLMLQRTVRVMEGHGDEILDLKVSPSDEWVLLSSSSDESIRLWNLKSGLPIAILAGRGGHLDSVISVDWNADASLIVSGGMDTTIKIWDTREGSEVRKAIAKSHAMIDLSHKTSTEYHEKPLLIEKPIFSTNKIHVNCVDCVQWVGDMILSKSVESRIELWFPRMSEEGAESSDLFYKGNVTHLHSFEYDDGEVWFIKFNTDPLHQRLAVGNVGGEVSVWDIGSESSRPTRVLTSVGNLRFPARGVSFSPCGNTLIICREDGTIQKWDLRRHKP